jgi:hypothetical protein
MTDASPAKQLNVIFTAIHQNHQLIKREEFRFTKIKALCSIKSKTKKIRRKLINNNLWLNCKDILRPIKASFTCKVYQNTAA